MPDERTDQQKAINNTLTSPEEDLRRGDRSNYPPGGGQEIRAGSGGRHAPPGYAAPPGRMIDRDVDPAAPEVHPGEISHHPGESTAAVDAGRGPGEAAPPGTVPDREGGTQRLPDATELNRTVNPAGLGDQVRSEGGAQ